MDSSIKINYISKLIRYDIYLYYKHYFIGSSKPSKILISGKSINNSLGIIDNIFLILRKSLFCPNIKGVHMKINPKQTTDKNTISMIKYNELYLLNNSSNI